MVARLITGDHTAAIRRSTWMSTAVAVAPRRTAADSRPRPAARCMIPASSRAKLRGMPRPDPFAALAGADRSCPLPEGARLGRYVIVRHLATGGMSELYLARSVGIEGFE